MPRPRCQPLCGTVPSGSCVLNKRFYRIGRRSVFFSFSTLFAIRSFGSKAQQPSSPTIGVLVVGAPGWDRFWRLFQNAMRDLGYVEGRSVRYEFRSDGGQASRLPELAQELVRLKVDLIVTWYTPPAQAAKRATRDIPIVMALAGNPVETGLVDSLDRPGGNVTGMAGAAAELSSKTVQLTRELLPSAHRIIALANAADAFSRPFVEYIYQGGQATGTAIDARMIRDAEELEAVFAGMAADPPGAVIVQPSLPRRKVAELAVRYRIPAVSVIYGFAGEGGLMSYAPAEGKIYRRAAAIVDKILKGAKPAELPVERPTTFELVINLRTAKALGVSIPPSLLTRADEVIE